MILGLIFSNQILFYGEWLLVVVYNVKKMVKQFVSNMNLYISYFATSQDQKRKMTCFSSV